MPMTPTLLVIVGPTAVGKTALAIRLAQHYRTEIVSADARQFYREMTLGTAKPSATERQQAPHHLVDFLSVTQPYHVRQFEEDALTVVKAIHRQRSLAVAVGGSGLYVQTLCDGIDDMPEVPPSVRQLLQQTWQKDGLAPLLKELQRVDPDCYDAIDRQNPRRVLRALEVYRSSGHPYSSFTAQRPQAPRPFRTVLIGLDLPRDVLYERINRRVDDMLTAGLVAEARSLLPYRSTLALRTVGYQELFPVFDQTYDLPEGVRLIKRNSRRYAKRQLTWFRRDPRIQWFDASLGTDHVAARITEYVQTLYAQ